MNGTRLRKNKTGDIGYAVTLTYKRPWGTTPKDQFNTSIYEVIRGLKATCSHFEISPECMGNGNIHYHITLILRDRIKWFKQVLPRFKRNGHVCIKSCDDPEGWRAYCTKDSGDMKEILELDYDLPITLDHVKLHFGKARKDVIDWEELHNDISTYFTS